MDQVTQIEQGPVRVIGTERTGHYRDIALMIPMLFERAMKYGCIIEGPPAFICHESSGEEAMKADADGSAHLEAVLPVSGDIPDDPDIRVYQLPGGKMARIVHKGPYEKVGGTYAVLFRWLDVNGKDMTGPLRELYLNDPAEVPPDEILTEIHAPIG